MEEQAKKKFQKWPIVVLALLIVLLIGGTFAWFTLQLTGSKVNTIKAGSLSMELDDEASDGILLQKAIPMSYQQGLTTTNYEFTLTNNGSKSDYTLSLKDELTYTDSEGTQVTIASDKKIADTKIRYILLKDGEEAASSKSMLLSEAENRVIDSGTIASGTTITYSLRIWIDSKAENEVMGQIFNARLQLDATQHQEVNSNAEAKIGTTYYNTLSEAIDAVPTDNTKTTITILKDIPNDNYTNYKIDSGKYIVLDNDYVINIRSYIDNYGKLELTGSGTILVSSVLRSYENSELIIDTVVDSPNQPIQCDGNLTIKSNASINSFITYINTSVKNREINIEGGTITSQYTPSINFYSGDSFNTILNISGGTITTASSNYALAVTGTINITNGTISSAGPAIHAGYGTLNILGGYIKSSDNTYALDLFSINTTIEKDAMIEGGGTSSNQGTITYNGTGSLTISGGTIKNNNTNGYTISYLTSGGSTNVSITGGTITPQNYNIYQ